MPDPDMIVTPDEQKRRDLAAQNLKVAEVEDAKKVLQESPEDEAAQQQVEALQNDLEHGITSGVKPTRQAVTLPRVMDALRQAHEKGDKDNATRLAEIARKMLARQKAEAEDNKHDASEYEAPKEDKSTWIDKIKGGVEAATKFVTGAAGGLAGLVAEAGQGVSEGSDSAFHNKRPSPEVDPSKMKEDIQTAATYQPRTAKGKEYAHNVETPESLLNPLTYVKAIGDAGESLKEQTDDPGTKAAIDVAFNAATTALPKVPKAAVAGTKYLMRGGEEAAAKMRENIGTFKRAEVDKPTLGQVSEGGLTKGSLSPQNVVERQAPDIAARADKLASRLDTARTSEEAGKVIRTALEGTPEMETLKVRGRDVQSPTGRTEGGWIKDVKTKEDQLHSKWLNAVGEKTPVFLPSTLNTLKELTSVTQGAEATTAAALNPKIMDLYTRLRDDAGKSRSLPLSAVEEIRQAIGAMTDPSLEARISSREANKLYAALKQDVGDAVARKSPAAKKAYNDAFEYSRNMHDISDSIIEPILRAKTPEKAFAAATSGTKEGASTLRTLLEGNKEQGIKGLNPAEADVVKAVVLRKLGSADSGAFKSENFFVNWAKMHDDVKTTLFGKEGSSLRKDLDNISKVIEKSHGSKSTIYQLRDYAMGHGAEGVAGAASVVAGQRRLGEILLAGPIMGFVTGRMITNPKVIKWLAQSTTKSPASLLPMLANLEQRVADEDPETKKEVNQYVNNIKGALSDGQDSHN